VLPLVSNRHAVFLNNEVPGIHIPEEMLERLLGSAEASAKEGVHIALELVEEMMLWVSGIYLMPQFNRYDLAAEVIEGCR
jgi:methionine synthase / methylenetetrahydrofolate reductase (NADH)